MLELQDISEDRFPFTEEWISGNISIRTFDVSVAQTELVWHKDHEKREVDVISGENWKLQLEDSVPMELNVGDKIFIEKMKWHRVIKGTTSLVVKITKFI